MKALKKWIIFLILFALIFFMIITFFVYKSADLSDIGTKPNIELQSYTPA